MPLDASPTPLAVHILIYSPMVTDWVPDLRWNGYNFMPLRYAAGVNSRINQVGHPRLGARLPGQVNA